MKQLFINLLLAGPAIRPAPTTPLFLSLQKKTEEEEYHSQPSHLLLLLYSNIIIAAMMTKNTVAYYKYPPHSSVRLSLPSSHVLPPPRPSSSLIMI